jgi:hypothetical protein
VQIVFGAGERDDQQIHPDEARLVHEHLHVHAEPGRIELVAEPEIANEPWQRNLVERGAAQHRRAPPAPEVERERRGERQQVRDDEQRPEVCHQRSQRNAEAEDHRRHDDVRDEEQRHPRQLVFFRRAVGLRVSRPFEARQQERPEK